MQAIACQCNNNIKTMIVLKCAKHFILTMKEGEIINKNKFKRVMKNACNASYMSITAKCKAF